MRFMPYSYERTSPRQVLSESDRKRVGNEDRDRYVDHLSNCVATGHLKQDEFSERRDKALTAVTVYDLNQLVEDLPPVPKGSGKTVRVVYAQDGHRFGWKRWAFCTGIGVSLIALPGPITASVYHGFGNGPAGGDMAIFLLIIGVICTFVCGISMAPGKVEFEEVKR